MGTPWPKGSATSGPENTKARVDDSTRAPVPLREFKIIKRTSNFFEVPVGPPLLKRSVGDRSIKCPQILGKSSSKDLKA
jgi:hypothetical protein